VRTLTPSPSPPYYLRAATSPTREFLIWSVVRPSPCWRSLGAFAAPTSRTATPSPNLLHGLTWRNLGPFRAGRVAAVSGAIGQPGVFYMGLPLGGVWKTTSAGETWFPIFDDVKDVSSGGAVEVAPSDPNVIYAGMGDLVTGGGMK